MENIHTRLRHEIERIYGAERGALARASRDMGMPSVQELSDVVGERKRITANLLAQVAAIGVDVTYVVTGERAATAHSGWSLPQGAEHSRGQVLLKSWHLAALLNMRAERGKNRPLLWGPAMLQAVQGYQPHDPCDLVIQRFVQKAKHGRDRQSLALYLMSNAPGEPWFIWPTEGIEQEVYPLDTGDDTLPIFIPEANSVPAPALLLDPRELSQLRLNGTLVVPWHGPYPVTGERPAPELDERTERALRTSFMRGWSTVRVSGDPVG